MFLARTLGISIAAVAMMLASAGCDRAARGADGNPPDTKSAEITENPDVLLSGRPTSELTLNGVKLGDPASAIPDTIIKSKSDDHLVCTNASYTIINGLVWSMSLTDRKKLNQLHVPQDEPELIQMRLGKADQIEGVDADNKKSWRGYWFATKRSAHFSADDDYTGWISVTVCR